MHFAILRLLLRRRGGGLAIVESKRSGGSWSFLELAKLVMPLVLLIAGGLSGFAIQATQTSSKNDVEIDNLKARVTSLEENKMDREEFKEVIKRLDEKTDRIEAGVDLLTAQATRK